MARGVCAGTAARVSAAGVSCGSGRAPACVRARSPLWAAASRRVAARLGPYDPRGAMSGRSRGPFLQAGEKVCCGPAGRALRVPMSARVAPGRTGPRAGMWAAGDRRAGQARAGPRDSRAGPRLRLEPAWGSGMEVARLRGDPRPLRLRRASGRRSQPRPAGPPPGCKGRCGATGEDAGSGLLGLPLRRASTGHSFPGGFPPCFLDGPRPGVRRGRRR